MRFNAGGWRGVDDRDGMQIDYGPGVDDDPLDRTPVLRFQCTSTRDFNHPWTRLLPPSCTRIFCACASLVIPKNTRRAYAIITSYPASMCITCPTGISSPRSKREECAHLPHREVNHWWWWWSEWRDGSVGSTGFAETVVHYHTIGVFLFCFRFFFIFFFTFYSFFFKSYKSLLGFR